MKLEKKLHENIYYYTNVFKNPQWIIDTLNELDKDEQTHTAITKWYKWLASNNQKDCFGEKKDLFYSQKESLLGNNAQKSKNVIDLMKNTINELCYKFVEDRSLNINPNISPFLDMCKYTKGGSLGVHYDGQDGDKSLMYSIVLYFNDNYEGGELSFKIHEEGKPKPGNSIKDPNIDFWIKPLPGSAVVFPSTYPYLHQSHPIKSGEKYMSTSFIFVEGYDPFNPEHIKSYREK